MGGFLLYHPEINLVSPPPKLCSILMIPSIDRQCPVAPPPFALCTLLVMTVSPPCYPENHVILPSFFLSPPPPVINNDRCFIFNFPLSRKKQSHIISPKNMSSTSRKWETLFVFSFFFSFLLCSLDAISSKFWYVFIESPVKKMTKPSKPWQKLISLRIVLNRRKL